MKENISNHSWLLQRIRKKKSYSCDPMNYSLNFSLPGSSVHGILQARILEWLAISFSRASSQLRDPTLVSGVSCIAGRFFTHWAIGEALGMSSCPSFIDEITETQHLWLIHGYTASKCPKLGSSFTPESAFCPWDPLFHPWGSRGLHLWQDFPWKSIF